MKILIMADNEGASGNDDYRMGWSDFAEQYAQGCENQVQDVNAAIRGALAAGATQIDILDGHGGGGNIKPERLHKSARLLGGAMALFEMLQSGQLGAYSALVLIGQHAQAGTLDGYLSHTNNGAMCLRFNGLGVGEIEELAWMVGEFGVRTVMVSGDDAACREAQALLPGVRTAAVKTATDRLHVTCMPLDESRARIEQTVRDAVEHLADYQPYVYMHTGPISVEVILARPEMAKAAFCLPRSRLVPPSTITFEAAGFDEAFMGYFTVMRLASQVDASALMRELEELEPVRDILQARVVKQTERLAKEPPFPTVKY